MILAGIFVILVVASIILSYISVKNDMKKQQHVMDVQKKLAKGRVLYYSPASSSSSE